MLAPVVGESRNLVIGRTSPNSSLVGNPFSLSTKLSVKALLDILINGELNLEAQRRKLRNLYTFNPRVIFERIAGPGASSLTESDVKELTFS